MQCDSCKIESALIFCVRCLFSLKKMRTQMQEGAPLLVSFYARRSDEIYFKRIYATANFFRALLSREKLEFGDDL